MTKPLKVLIIEDELMIATDIEEKLTSMGYDVIAIARNYNEAVNAIEKTLPDVVLADINLEDSTHDGVATVKELLTYHSMPVIYLTGYSEPETVQYAQETSPAAYLLKPFRTHELAIQIELAYTNSTKVKKQAHSNSNSDFLYLPFNKGYEKLSKSDVIYLQANGAYVNAYMLNEQQPKLFSMNLGYITQHFSDANFYRLSRSLLINLDFIERVERTQLWMQSLQKPISISEAKSIELMKRLVIVKTPH